MVTSIRADRDVPMATRDGVTLRADVYRPDDNDPHPAILVRTPHNEAPREDPRMANPDGNDDPTARTSADWPRLKRRVDDVRADWRDAFQGMDLARLLPGRRTDDVWTAWHVLNHTAAYLDAASDMLDALAQGETVDYSAAQKWLGDGVAAGEIAAALERAWSRYLNAVGRASDAYDPRATVTHVTAGTMDARGWVTMGAAHLRKHAQRLRDAT